MVFTIDTDNNITAFCEPPANTSGETFSNEKELGKLAAAWPSGRIVEIWNSFAGVAPFDDLKPVKKFTDRKAAVSRIWKAVQRLTPAVAPPVADVAPEEETANTKASAPKKAAKATKSAKAGKAERKPKAAGGAARDGSKKATVLALLKRPGGATLKEIMSVTDWQAHSVRGFMSGALGKKMGLAVESTRREDGERCYRLG